MERITWWWCISMQC